MEVHNQFCDELMNRENQKGRPNPIVKPMRKVRISLAGAVSKAHRDHLTFHSIPTVQRRGHDRAPVNTPYSITESCHLIGVTRYGVLLLNFV